MKTPSELRQAWLEDATRDLRKHFTACGYTVPDKLRVSVGWPKGSRGGNKTIGQCWSDTVCTDKHFETFISPALRDGDQIFGVLAHELVHATVGLKVGHKGAFKHCATTIGLEGKMTATTNGPAMAERAKAFITKHGKYPAGAIVSDKGRVKQGTRLIKCECSECGYIARTTAKWIENGTPLCPCNSEPMMVEQ